MYDQFRRPLKMGEAWRAWDDVAYLLARYFQQAWEYQAPAYNQLECKEKNTEYRFQSLVYIQSTLQKPYILARFCHSKSMQRHETMINAKHKAMSQIQPMKIERIYRFSTSRTCIAAYAMMIRAPEITARPATSNQ